MEHTPLSVALIGAGKFGKNHERLLEFTEGISFAGVVTASSDLKTEDVFLDGSVDAVVIATPAATHFSLARDALKSGKHVLLEKPMVLSNGDAQELEKLVSETGLIFTVGYQYVYNDSVRFLKDTLEPSEVTRVIAEHRLSPAREDVNAFWDAAPHPLSIIHYLFSPGDVVDVTGEAKNTTRGKQEDFIHAIVTYESGLVLDITTTWNGEVKTRKLTFSGQDIEATLDETLAENKLSLSRAGKPQSIPEATGEPLRNELERFFECIRTKETPITDVSFGARVTRDIVTILEAIS